MERKKITVGSIIFTRPLDRKQHFFSGWPEGGDTHSVLRDGIPANMAGFRELSMFSVSCLKEESPAETRQQDDRSRTQLVPGTGSGDTDNRLGTGH